MTEENGQCVVFVGPKNSVFVTRTAETLRVRGVEVSVLDPGEAQIARPAGGKFSKLARMVERMWKTAVAIRHLDRNQTVVIHFLSVDIIWLAPLLKRRFRRVVGLAYGSDILRRVKSRDRLLRFGLASLDCIAATNINVMDVIKTDFPKIAKRETRIIRFGLPVFDALDAAGDVSSQEARRRLGFDTERPLICVGYAASPGQRQQDLLGFFASQSDRFQHYNFVVPVQYGSGDVREKIVAECKRLTQAGGPTTFQALTTFHEPETAALMRRATTVLINHSISDAFSGTVQEVLYAGNLVLAAEHLPYANMPGFGTGIKPYNTLEDCAAFLEPGALAHWQQTARTTYPETCAALRATSSWEGVINDWYALIAPPRSQEQGS